MGWGEEEWQWPDQGFLLAFLTSHGNLSHYSIWIQNSRNKYRYVNQPLWVETKVRGLKENTLSLVHDGYSVIWSQQCQIFHLSKEVSFWHEISQGLSVCKWPLAKRNMSSGWTWQGWHLFPTCDLKFDLLVFDCEISVLCPSSDTLKTNYLMTPFCSDIFLSFHTWYLLLTRHILPEMVFFGFKSHSLV